MRNYAQAEVCLLLLTASFTQDPPITARQFARLERSLSRLGASTETDVTLAELMRLGLGLGEAEAALRRLASMDALRDHLRAAHAAGVRLVTRISPEYPARLRTALGEGAPLLLYCAGNLDLLSASCVSLVGSRQLRPPGRDFARAAGSAIASSGLVYVSGGAAGADTEGFLSASRLGGSAILFLPDSLLRRVSRCRPQLDAGRLLLVSLDGMHEAFSVPRAFARNRLIHAMGEKVLVAQVDEGRGGTWQGVQENFKRAWCPVYMSSAEPEDPGARALLAAGAIPVLPEALPALLRS